jgi:hypothetical protein
MNTIIQQLKLGVMIAAVTVLFTLTVSAQGPWAGPAVPGFIGTPSPELPVQPMPSGETMERSIAVHKDVNLSLCVTQGNLKITGWNRNEVRVYVQDGAKFGFKVLEKNKQNSPVWVMLTAAVPERGKAAECIWGEEIEIDVPMNTTVAIKGQETKTSIDSIRKAKVQTIGGDITIHNVSAGVIASTYEGDVTVEGSQGAFNLESTTGNILIFDAGPSEIGDTLRAKTNSGLISLQRIKHRQIDAGSISGSIAYNGEILNGGTYSLSTSNGSIRMALPPTTSCKVSALYGFGSFNSELPFKIETENIEEGPVKRVYGSLGKDGDATLKLTTNNGSIAIKKL